MAEVIYSDGAAPPAPPTDATPDADIEGLRAELKAWEKSFAQTHDGKKPGRADIKAEPSIGRRLPPLFDSL
jgi:hypothetical protein